MVHRPLPSSRLRTDERGVTALEFALVSPVLLMMLMFLFDTGYYLYAKAILAGEVNAAGRASTLETATDELRDTLDAQVSTAVERLVPNGHMEFQRMAYKSYGRAQAKAEDFVDANNNGVCDNGESFDDANRNGTRDLDSGVSGGGGAKDVTVYTATLRYDRLFPLNGFLGVGREVTMSSSTLLRNQPFDKQAEPLIGTCP
ncbi:hypothetical protein SCLO_1011080 [Sphingobium cloacae]|uniref:TadE-like domain-containing protein n=2 Tax=Sphingobium cloacae TaxID=120107 RepID=A0A1E1F0T2_9SPHN|nr:hypothetical protein SCLO_1011080 [Sphingobium cloacae]